jgi:hypothetical protein
VVIAVLHSNGHLKYRLITKKFIPLSREPAVLANLCSELTVSANLGQLGNQQEAGTGRWREPYTLRSSPRKPAGLPYHHWQLAFLAYLWRKGTPVATKVCRNYQQKTKVSGGARRKLKIAGASQGGKKGIQQLACVAIPKPVVTLTKMPKRPRSEGSTPTDMANTFKKPTVFTGPGTYREAPTNEQIAILKENYPENKLSEEDQKLILAEITGGI